MAYPPPVYSDLIAEGIKHHPAYIRFPSSPKRCLAIRSSKGKSGSLPSAVRVVIRY